MFHYRHLLYLLAWYLSSFFQPVRRKERVRERETRAGSCYYNMHNMGMGELKIATDFTFNCGSERVRRGFIAIKAVRNVQKTSLHCKYNTERGRGREKYVHIFGKSGFSGIHFNLILKWKHLPAPLHSLSFSAIVRVSCKGKHPFSG
jgi:hypothetical protein